MKLSEFDYDLDRDLIAQRPASPRDDSKLFYLKEDGHQHLRFFDIVDLLQKGDVLVRNRSKVVPARVHGKKDTGGEVEILLSRPVDDGLECLVKGNNIQVGRQLFVDDIPIDIVGDGEGGQFILDLEDAQYLMEEYGSMPTPPYIKEELDSPDEYQTTYAEEEGSVAAPTAGFHFTEELTEDIEDKGVDIFDITLHVGPGTFLPVKEEEVEQHDMGEEYYEVPENTAEAINEANEEGRRVILVGTTTVRALETVSENGVVEAGNGWTDLFIYPDYKFQSGIDLMLTNFHLPKSTLLMLVSAFAGKERIFDAYQEAVKRDYRFYSFGDAMLIEGKI